MGTWKKFLILGSIAIVLTTSTAHALTNEEILAQLKALYEAVALVEAQIKLYTPSTSATPATQSGTPSCLRLASNLRAGQRDVIVGGPISALQLFLKNTGDFTYPEITGYFGPATQIALKKFQSRSAIVSSGTPEGTGYGVAGPRTRLYIETTSCAVPTPTTSTPVTSARECSINGTIIQNGVSIKLYSAQNAPNGQSCASLAATRTCTNGVLDGVSAAIYSSCTSVTLRACTLGDIAIAHGESRTLYDKVSVSSGDTCATHSQSRKCTDGKLSGNTAFSKASCEGPRACTLDGATLSDGQSRDFFYLQHIPAGELCSSYALGRSCGNGVLGGDTSYKYASCAPVSSTSCTAHNIVLETGSSTTFFTSMAAPAGATCASISQVRSCTSGSLSGSASHNRAWCVDNAPCTLDGVTVTHASSSTFYSARTVGFGITCSSVAQIRTCTNALLSGGISFKYAGCVVAPPSSCTLDGITLTTGSSDVFYKSATVPHGSPCEAITRSCSQGVLIGSGTYQYANCTINDPPEPSVACDQTGNSSGMSSNCR